MLKVPQFGTMATTNGGTSGFNGLTMYALRSANSESQDHRSCKAGISALKPRGTRLTACSNEVRISLTDDLVPSGAIRDRYHAHAALVLRAAWSAGTDHRTHITTHHETMLHCSFITGDLKTDATQLPIVRSLVLEIEVDASVSISLGEPRFQLNPLTLPAAIYCRQ